ncbi:MAG: hydroxylamine reductase [Acidipropionibacterium sp.]|jgi:hydroxylamine reductase|nr:hydroxylamine reductase [Acidipropionibacterium sp.]
MMFCYQCEQADRSGPIPGCSLIRGTCGKDEPTSALQDLLIYQLKGVADYAAHARSLGAGDDEAAGFLALAMFTTLTNVNFSQARFVELIRQAEKLRIRLKARYERAAADAGVKPQILTGPAAFVPAGTTDGLIEQAASRGILAGVEEVGPDVIGLRALNLYGLKGICAYIHHAAVMGYTDPAVFKDVEDALVYLGTDPSGIEDLLEHALGLGRTNLAVLDMLNRANSGSFGTPSPTLVRTTPVAGHAILISGHDFPGLKALLEQTEGTGINVYTHGEMLPAHGYPELRRYPNLVGNYGGAWQDQQVDFANFPGPIVMTSNCMIEPRQAYKHQIFTNGPVGWPGVRHIVDHDFSEVIRAARALPGFPETVPEKSIPVGFGHRAVLELSDEVLDAVRTGQLTHIFVMGGCDGASPGRNYFREYAQATPDDTLILTMGCAKYRFNDLDFGTLIGLPRLLDVGQCNDSYSAVRIAMGLADGLGCEVNDLPLTMVLSWFEQKAVAVLLTLLALGIRNINLGPTLPAFLTPAAIQIVVERFGLHLIGDDPIADLHQALAGAVA